MNIGHLKFECLNELAGSLVHASVVNKVNTHAE